MKTAEQDILLFLCLVIVAVMLFGCESSKTVTVRKYNPSPVSSEPEPSYGWLSWKAISNGVIVSGVPMVISYSTNLRTWERVATNSTGHATFATQSPANFFKLEAL